MRATLRLSSPAWLAQPRTTSAIARRVERRDAARAARGSTCAARSSGAHLAELSADVADGGGRRRDERVVLTLIARLGCGEWRCPQS